MRNHSPSGFEWGYNGSGPAQTALALVLDFTGDPIEAQLVYQDIKFKLIGTFKMDYWKIYGRELSDAISRAHIIEFARNTTHNLAAALLDGRPTQRLVSEAATAMTLTISEIEEAGGWDEANQWIAAHRGRRILAESQHIDWLEKQFRDFTGISLPAGFAAQMSAGADLATLPGKVEDQMRTAIGDILTRSRVLPVAEYLPGGHIQLVQDLSSCQAINGAIATLAVAGAMWGMGGLIGCFVCGIAGGIMGVFALLLALYTSMNC